MNRSAHLVMVEGVCVLLTMVVAVNGSINVVWDSGLDWFWMSLLLFFISPALKGSYICRALRLAVVFHPRAKRALPWLIPERNYMVVLLVVSVGMMAIPIYQEYTLEVWEIIPKQTTILTTEALVFAVTLACIYPFIRNVDDLFNISKELLLVTVAIVCLAVVQKAAAEWGGVYEQRWVGNNISIFIAAVLFGISIVDPLRRLAMDPLAATKRNYADRVLLSRTAPDSTVRTASGVSSGRSRDPSRIRANSEEEARLEEGDLGGVLDKDETTTAGDVSNVVASAVVGNGVITTSTADTNDAVAAGTWNEREPINTSVFTKQSSSVSNDTSIGGNRRDVVQRGPRERAFFRGRRGGGGGRGRPEREEMEVWNFERLARTPLLAVAFEDYSKRALCHESVLFLTEVSRYQHEDYATPTKDAIRSSPSQFGTFCYITNTFIKAGSPEEVNISDADKKRILELYQKGEEHFEDVNEEERRLIFGRAYLEVKSMLEANLLRRFLNTDRFKSVRMQRENVQTMMDSPPLPAGVAAA
ncbi:expressed unknown protein [Ectocarpus siliculosus]|uniref:RGS domain-containing protein n=1 Tax=Ectocarpus siliculosus TaxID=2880 RepID=D7G2T7_ECTSI|nr:expressed unknown protein [Ectocarpus siliculosus]|eukprot:CBJ33441.1 expressed unknown protein [Ectocarpus siliculosus]